MFNFSYILVLVYFFTYCNAIIKVNLEVASTRGGIKVDFDGFHDKNITDKEINIFNITEPALKTGFRVEIGKRPDDVFLKDPNYYGNLYQKYEWEEIKRRLFVKNVTVYDIINEKVVLIVHDHINNTTKTSKIKVDIFKSMENTISSTWSKDGLPDDDIFYKIEINFNGTPFGYNNKWRNDTIRTKTVLVGLRNKGYVDVAPGNAISMKLSAKKTILLIKITYIATLKGQVVANYAHVYGKYHFWAPSISNIMKAAKLNNYLVTTEVVEVKCYTDPRLDVFDKTSGKKLSIVFANKPFRFRHSKLYRNKHKL